MRLRATCRHRGRLWAKLQAALLKKKTPRDIWHGFMKPHWTLYNIPSGFIIPASYQSRGLLPCGRSSCCPPRCLPVFPRYAFPCCFLSGRVPLTQLCECCLPQEKLQTPDQQSKTGGFWELHLCGGEPAGKGQLHWHDKRPKQWVPSESTGMSYSLAHRLWLFSGQAKDPSWACTSGNMHEQQLSTLCLGLCRVFNMISLLCIWLVTRGHNMVHNQKTQHT